MLPRTVLKIIIKVKIGMLRRIALQNLKSNFPTGLFIKRREKYKLSMKLTI